MTNSRPAFLNMKKQTKGDQICEGKKKKQQHREQKKIKNSNNKITTGDKRELWCTKRLDLHEQDAKKKEKVETSKEVENRREKKTHTHTIK